MTPWKLGYEFLTESYPKVKSSMSSKLVTLVATSMLLFCCLVPAQEKSGGHQFAIDGDHFALDGKPFQIISGEMHYARIPREYWRDRLRKARAMGLNTISTYVFWNV